MIIIYCKNSHRPYDYNNYEDHLCIKNENNKKNELVQNKKITLLHDLNVQLIEKYLDVNYCRLKNISITFQCRTCYNNRILRNIERNNVKDVTFKKCELPYSFCHQIIDNIDNLTYITNPIYDYNKKGGGWELFICPQYARNNYCCYGKCKRIHIKINTIQKPIFFLISNIKEIIIILHKIRINHDYMYIYYY